MKYHTYIQGENKYIDFKNLLEAIFIRGLYNFWHEIKRDGKYMCPIFKKVNVFKSNTDKRP